MNEQQMKEHIIITLWTLLPPDVTLEDADELANRWLTDLQQLHHKSSAKR